MIDLIGYWVGVTILSVPYVFLTYLGVLILKAILFDCIVDKEDREGLDRIFEKFLPSEENVVASIAATAFLTLLVLGNADMVAVTVTVDGVQQQGKEFVDNWLINGISNIAEWTSPGIGWVFVVTCSYILYIHAGTWLYELFKKARALKGKLDGHIADKQGHK